MNKWVVKKITHNNPYDSRFNYRAWALITPDKAGIAFADTFKEAQKNFPAVVKRYYEGT